MAGDWIPMRLDLCEDPSVMHIADQLKVREEIVVGYLHKIWCWASRQCHTGRVTNVTLMSLGRVTNLTGFPELMRDAGWLAEGKTDDGVAFIEFPNWENWMSESAKKRLQNAKRQKKSRLTRENDSHGNVTKLSRTKRDKNVTTVQESRGKDTKEETPNPFLSLRSDLQEAAQQWLRYKTERNERYKPTGLQALVSRMNSVAGERGSAAVVDAIQKAMSAGWKGWENGLAGKQDNFKKDVCEVTAKVVVRPTKAHDIDVNTGKWYVRWPERLPEGWTENANT